MQDRPLNLRSAREAIQHGITMVMQETSLAPDLSVLENVFLAELGRRGAQRVDVVCPGFVADCLETLEEIAVENAHLFKKHGGKNFAAIPCLNDSGPGMLVIWQLALRELKGWV